MKFGSYIQFCGQSRRVFLKWTVVVNRVPVPHPPPPSLERPSRNNALGCGLLKHSTVFPPVQTLWAIDYWFMFSSLKLKSSRYALMTRRNRVAYTKRLKKKQSYHRNSFLAAQIWAQFRHILLCDLGVCLSLSLSALKTVYRLLWPRLWMICVWPCRGI